MDDLEELQLLGRGGYASSSDLYALKRIPRSKIVSEQQKLRLEAEKFVLLHATSPFLCRGFESFATTAQVAFLLEFIDGRALYECVWKYRETGKFPEHVAKFFAAQLVLALRDLHAQGFIHRDLKSGNVLVGKDGFIKVIDFGLAKKLVGGADGDPTERTQSMCGTHYVMAPEVFYREAYGFAIDWWSLGVVIYEMAVGHPPWEYQCPAYSTMDEYFQLIKRVASSAHNYSEERLGDDLRSLVSGLLKLNPRERLGRNGAAEV
ncbi:hypothetical protein PHYSODRAFT_293527 [Phytophthora sojae]|uniref:Protein kinase domain-containing protein n=1 Tax=Phytophthora sojae (strain P6497) TaxID=1094619 RepID=G4YK55_PHYSP|nr:hypothetical protein PHYSODRAFT_293527 [Phytophthora sojae]EGZ27817.1 hypothetical protein PHYSODRAFT_293527 [Phytophthora sojae]|eukprot:XP_009515092.1 hypothetical protein PHYSODRAFT_293527 [Phytophthora sojae]